MYSMVSIIRQCRLVYNDFNFEIVLYVKKSFLENLPNSTFNRDSTFIYIWSELFDHTLRSSHFFDFIKPKLLFKENF